MSTVVIPTLGRPTLANAIRSLHEQSEEPTMIVVKLDQRDTLVKIREAVNECATEFFIIAEDDAQYPRGWVSALSSCMGADVGFVGGPCLPLIGEHSTFTEKAIAEVVGSYLGTLNMSYRWKPTGGPPREVDETNLVGNGMYRTAVLRKILNDEYARIPIAAYETYLFTRIRLFHYKTMLNPSAYFYHQERSSLAAFARQIFRNGTGRMGFFKRFPRQIPRKAYIFAPMLLVLGTALMPLFPALFIPWFLYLLVVFSKGLKAPFYLTMHYAYGMGLLYGLLVVKDTWT